jgi:hypothetical protein
MSEVKHTPGPHYAVDYAGRIEMQSSDFYELGANLLDAADVGEEQMNANGTLYAAAPDLLEAIQELQQWIRPDSIYWGTSLNDRVEAAIKRARGL